MEIEAKDGRHTGREKERVCPFHFNLPTLKKRGVSPSASQSSQSAPNFDHLVQRFSSGVP